MTLNTIKNVIGKTYLYPVNGMTVECEILDAKNAYGNDRILIRPYRGSGEIWVNYNQDNVK